MVAVRIDRRKKNIMRAQLEEVLQIQKDLEHKIEGYEKQTEPEEYRQFWRELKGKNGESIRRISTYMVNKCNR